MSLRNNANKKKNQLGTPRTRQQRLEHRDGIRATELIAVQDDVHDAASDNSKKKPHLIDRDS